MEVSRVDIDMVQQVLMKECMITLWAIARQAEKLIEAEKPDATKIKMRRSVQMHQIPVEFNRRVARSQAES
jgi:hypothetical protein